MIVRVTVTQRPVTCGGLSIRAAAHNLNNSKMKAVRFEAYGEVDVLQVVEVPDPVPAEREVLVRVKAAGINPGEAAIRKGLLHARWPALERNLAQ